MNAVNILARDLQIGDEIVLNEKTLCVAVVDPRPSGTYVVAYRTNELPQKLHFLRDQGVRKVLPNELSTGSAIAGENLLASTVPPTGLHACCGQPLGRCACNPS